eukprot:14952548-Alexandrium_andersonii.AAC.1
MHACPRCGARRRPNRAFRDDVDVAPITQVLFNVTPFNKALVAHAGMDGRPISAVQRGRVATGENPLSHL